MISSDDVINSKPNPEPYLLAFKRSSFKKEECIIIEDSPLGIQSANSAGITSIGIETTVSKEDLSNANYIFKNHKELFEFLSK